MKRSYRAIKHVFLDERPLAFAFASNRPRGSGGLGVCKCNEYETCGTEARP